MIIWIASYPKSGNTWLRAFITSLLYKDKNLNVLNKLKQIHAYPLSKDFYNLLDNFENFKDISENWEKSQSILNLDKKIKFLKTHHVNCTIKDYKFYNDSNSLGAIHIVRDPRNVLISIKNHFLLKDLDEAKEFILKEKNWVGIVKNKNYFITDNQIPTLISSWKINYLSWKNKVNNYLLVKYEDLVKNPKKEFFRISHFLEKIMNTKFKENKILNSIKTSSFDNMQNLEKKGLFKEYVKSENNRKIKFFNLGPKNDWKLHLNKEIVEEINFKFKKEMEELGYL